MKNKGAKTRETRPDLHTCSVGTRWTDSSIVKIRLQNFVQNLFLLFTDVGFGLWNLSQTDAEKTQRKKKDKMIVLIIEENVLQY